MKLTNQITDSNKTPPPRNYIRKWILLLKICFDLWNNNSQSGFNNEYKNFLSFVSYTYDMIINLSLKYYHVIRNLYGIYKNVRLLFLSKTLIIRPTFGIVFNIEWYIFYTIKVRDNRMPICSQCRISCVENNTTLKFDCMHFSKFLVSICWYSLYQ